MKQHQKDRSTHLSTHRPTVQQRIELSIERSQRKLAQLEQELEDRKRGLLEQNRSRMIERIQSIQEMQQKRKKTMSESEERVRAVKQRELQRVTRRLQQEMKQKSNELSKQQKILNQRRQLRQPMNFEQIYLHQYTYLKHLNLDPPAPCQHLFSPTHHHQSLPCPPQSQRQQAKSMLQKRNQYAQQAERLYHNAKMNEEIKEQRERMYRRQSRRRRKQPCPELKEDPIVAMKNEIKGVAKSGRGFREKFGIIEGLSKSYISKYEASGKEYALELAAQANLALADLYLSQQ